MEHHALYDALKAVRARLAEQRGVPAFQVLSNAALAEFAERQPLTVQEAMEINGIGPVKAATVVPLFLEAIRLWRAANAKPATDKGILRRQDRNPRYLLSGSFRTGAGPAAVLQRREAGAAAERLREIVLAGEAALFADLPDPPAGAFEHHFGLFQTPVADRLTDADSLPGGKTVFR